jgi:alkanesulfonate monooxygenase SsuD/methylene tetrahydromethanopterin reductase-like flavin-dependent oxidoreductase (luciferase family)
MKIDSGILVNNPKDAGPAAKYFEDAGYDGIYTFEAAHDPFLPLVSAAMATEKVELITSIAVAFSRNPMILANIGYDLNLVSEGRFILGLGSQIKPHITKYKRLGTYKDPNGDKLDVMVVNLKNEWVHQLIFATLLLNR